MKYKYWLLGLRGIGNPAKKRLLEKYKGARQIYETAPEQMLRDQVLNERQCRLLEEQKNMLQLEDAFGEFLQKDQTFVTMEDAEYPVHLKEVYDAPYGLYVGGSLRPIKKSIAIVGARNCSAYGKKMAHELAAFLSRNGYDVISGMAKGIDAYAHKGCLEAGGYTAAVLGCGVDICYPAQNRGIYERIRQEGCLLSEYPPGSKPLAKCFPPRNRIISGIAECLIVVEAKEKSGSLITTDFALEQGKDIYVVPGRITDPLSTGCNQLISQGAGIITSIESFLKDRQTDFEELSVTRCLDAKQKILEKDEWLVYSCFDFYPKSIEEVLEETNLNLLQLLAIVGTLCDKGLLQEYFMNQYVRLR